MKRKPEAKLYVNSSDMETRLNKKAQLNALVETFYNKCHVDSGVDGGRFCEGSDGPGRVGEPAKDLGVKGKGYVSSKKVDVDKAARDVVEKAKGALDSIPKKAASGFPSGVRVGVDLKAENEKIIAECKEYLAGLTGDQRQTIGDYTGIFSKEINDYLLTGKLPPFNENIVKENVKHLDEAIEKAPKKDRVLYRGVDFKGKTQAELDAYVEENFGVGKEIGLAQGAYASTSLDVDAPLEHSVGSKSGGNTGIIFEIKTNRGAPISSGSMFSQESGSGGTAETEILLGRSDKFRVVGVQREVEFKDEKGKIHKRTVIQVEAV